MKLGDKVLITNNGTKERYITHNYKIGSIGTIVGIYTDDSYEVQVTGHPVYSSQSISAVHLRLITFDQYLNQAELCTID